MRLAFFVNSVATEVPEYTTTLLAYHAHRRGHEVFYISVEDFSYDPDEHVRAKARGPKKKTYKSPKQFLAELQQEDAATEDLNVDELDVLMLRNDPAGEELSRPWAQTVGILFGQIAARRGVIVLNDPKGLGRGMNKLYFQFFPEEIRPKTLISRDSGRIKRFLEEHGFKAVLKPLQGSGGKDVFVVKPGEKSNLNQIIETVGRSGYVVAQEYIPAAAKGDVRLFLMNGQPLRVGNKFAAFRRVAGAGDPRSNMHVGAKAQKVVITDKMLELADQVRPRLMHDGMFLVGLDIVGDKLMEVNIFSPGGLNSASKLEQTDFIGAVLDAVERKVGFASSYRKSLDNLSMAIL
jgi:glutathione synthase